MASLPSSPDEGFSEYPMESQSTPDSTVAVRNLSSYVNQMSVQDRAQLALHLLNGLPVGEFARVIEAIKPRLFINFFHQLPSEICLKILGFLDPQSLISAAQASQEWMALALDPHLWQDLYYQEGFRTSSELQKFEIEQENRISSRRPRSLGSADGHASKKRSIRDHHYEISSGEAGTFASDKGKAAERNFIEDGEMPDADPALPEQSLFGGSRDIARTSAGQRGEKGSSPDSDTAASTGLSRVPRNPRKSLASSGTSTPSLSAEVSSYPELLQSPNRASSGSRLIKPTLYLRDPDTGRLKLNWHHLYTQRRRLEANWEKGKHVNFQLPHPDHPEEAHGECVYAIQYSGKYLVSGSRDTTVRVWNMETRRLIRAPLLGHKGSVLCLQFDAHPDEDIIVSGSSDSDVVIWKFSTGELVQRLQHAHHESVLNLRFDKRILVTCSKDTTIKIFNRRPIRSDDPNFPQFDNVPEILNNYGFNPAPSAGITVKPAWTEIGCLLGHHAAVNAVQIHNNEIVSASGDRTVKVWDWPRSCCIRTLVGHNKGIACVQYDGRRIVSGSSDNEVKVFDGATGGEVASLRGHGSLVRTLQAGFGDLPYSREQDQEEAKATDEEFFKAVTSGTITDSQKASMARRKNKNAGSRNPEDITAYGAKIPPGGGGGRYGRIVSGSYDETIIIWRRDKNGVWMPQQTLRQDDAARGAVRQARPRPWAHVLTAARLTQDLPDAASADGSDSAAAPIPSALPHLSQAGPSSQVPAPPASHLTFGSVPPDSDITISSQHINQFQALLQNAVVAGPDTLRSTLDAHPILLLLPSLPTLIAALPSNGLRNEMLAISASSRITNGEALMNIHTLLENGPDSPIYQTTINGLAQAAARATSRIQLQLQHQAERERVANNVTHARIFKVQFCARRIVCCSQMRAILGWDFVAGDKELAEASRFFGVVE